LFVCSFKETDKQPKRVTHGASLVVAVHQAVDSRYAARVDRLMDNRMDRLRACPQVAHEPSHT